jgi:hypothetical protein
MKLRINSKDHNLVEDDFGNPIFRFLGLHPCDKDDIISAFNDNSANKYLRGELADAQKEISELEDQLMDAQDKLESISNIL